MNSNEIIHGSEHYLRKTTDEGNHGGKQMIRIAGLLSVLGGHFSLVVVGCAEVVVAAVLIATTAGRRFRKEKRIDKNLAEKIFLEELGAREDEVCLVVRRRDMMPGYVAGDIEKLLGVPLEALQEDVTILNQNMKDPAQGSKVWKAHREWDTKEPLVCEFQLKNDQWIQMKSQCSEDGRYELTTFRDITGFHQQVENYEKRLEKAEEASQSKTSFLSRMSHEIRTPMNGIMGMLTLAEGKLQTNDPALQYLTKAEELSEHLLSLINDILDMSRIEAGKVELENKSFSLHALGEKLYDMFAKNLEARGIYYAVNYEDMAVDQVIGDELRISQVIINFLSNAVKFTSEGEITVTFRQMMLQDGMADLMISVRDTGIGMDPEFINRIFRPFEQESIDTSKQYGGTGLGMAITDNLVRLMGGEIVVKSVPGEGSEFSVFLHLPEASSQKTGRRAVAEREVTNAKSAGAAKEPAETQNTANTFRGRRILMAEDNEINAMIAVEILKEMGAEVDLAEDGRIAVEMFASHPVGYYDFILMDVQMPVLDGRAAAREIRKMDRPDASEILIFALSADAFVEDERKSLESGMNGHYAKPVDFVALEKNVGTFLQGRKGGVNGR